MENKPQVHFGYGHTAYDFLEEGCLFAGVALEYG